MLLGLLKVIVPRLALEPDLLAALEPALLVVVLAPPSVPTLSVDDVTPIRFR
jgi:hypothetical protein